MLVRPIGKATKLFDDDPHILLQLFLHVLWSLELEEEDIHHILLKLELDSWE